MVSQLQKLSLLSAISLSEIFRIFNDELRKQVRRGVKAPGVFRLVFSITQGRIKRNYHSFEKCNFCINLHQYGCGEFRLAKKFRILHQRTRKHPKTSKDERLERLLSEIVSEFGELHIEVVKCAKRRSFLKRKLGYQTMDFELELPPSPIQETISGFIDPEKEIRKELEKLRKEKEMLPNRSVFRQRWRALRLKTSRFD